MCLGGQSLEEGACLTGTRKEWGWVVEGESYKSCYLGRIESLRLGVIPLPLRLDEIPNS